jgi:two-component system, chemotaxis family, chemotaxis protein CheY
MTLTTSTYRDDTNVATRRILVIDDDPVISGYIAETLGDEGYHAATAPNGAAALRLLERERAEGRPPPDLILLDMRMPVMDGWTFTRAYRETPEPHAPIVVITAAHDALDRLHEVGAFGVLPKPFDLDELLDEVERCFRETAA